VDNNYLIGNEKKIMRGIFFLSLLVFLAVLVLGMLPKAEVIPPFVRWLPRLNALINATCSLLLVISLYQIKKRNILLHKKLNILTFILSSMFLLSYVTFHSFGIETRFPAENPLRPIYLALLISHIILAAIVLPLVLLSFYYGLTNRVQAHRRLTRWSFPIWLYVTVTGVIVYLMISPYYRF
jgi:putative membrane protein